MRFLAMACLVAAGCGRLGFAAGDVVDGTDVDAAASADAAVVPPPDATPQPACLTSFDVILPSHPDNRYLLTPAGTVTTWADAAAVCAQDGGHLMIPDDAAEFAELAALAVVNRWIGLYESGADVLDVFAQPAPYQNWSVGQPDSVGQACVQLYHFNGTILMDDEYCESSPRPAVCECAPVP